MSEPLELKHLARLALKAFKGDESITIRRADKGNTTVFMNKDDYTSKMYAELDKGTYEPLQKAPSMVMNKLKKETCQALYKLKERSIGSVHMVSDQTKEPSMS